MLEVKQVSKVYEGQRGVHQLDFTMERGEIVGFLGPNGAGKTTTMRMITGYVHPTAGSIMVDGVSVHEQGQRVRSKIGYLPETPPLYPDMTVQSYLKFVANLRDVPAREVKLRVSEMVSRLGLLGRERQMVRGLSKGYKQRLGLAGAIIHKPDLLVLDEPTSGLDPNQIIEIRDLIRELGENHTVLLSTHILPEVSTLCNRMLIINQGQLVLDGSPQHFGSAMGDQFKVSIEVKATAEQLHNVLTPWEKVRSEVIQASDANTAKDTALNSDSAETVKMLLTGENSEDFREELFYLLSGAGLPILEMKKENLSLEQIFLKLTTTEATDTDANSADVDKVADAEMDQEDVSSDNDLSSISGTSTSTSTDASSHSSKREDSK
ncbi:MULTISPECIES: ABC transporter ATP-binding protein [unclassified Paenibacillus]|uniref:ABC transporter ATP-binding protein n=1 Tax=unclassified Paenibacillus TaxID=185978 RepID=UPI000CFD1BDF|nr:MULTISPECIES: ATP-binding cassette domain-containing protein [unclassified Paenibacillus]MBD8841923.1 ATP-binding cassette domain-containing protein [Paenibacillus sp. CFBP 13594]PRA02108.1 multidrug ABC transporter ATP-binding protein [Paenibacillus sp. MYb63]PRA44985.1 multidrug ABC transporter ATP-binding protein [Paenibacillus sp. MYb67]QZN75997.1 ABC transporter ATP-binding protein [Paenibacillus sp. DR312]